jgi:flagella basal body P-ring formation protein FlgA
VIHGGDRIIVEEHTQVVDAQLEAVAMGPAAAGGQFRVRLKIGGKIIAAVATSTGHAVVASPIGEPQ